MGPADVLVDDDWMQAQLDEPGVMPGRAGKDNPKRTRRRLQCSCQHTRDAHRHYRPGSDCAVCACPRWSPPNPVLWLARRCAR
jgi:hypothetical protein